LAKPLNACVPLQSRAHHYEYVYSNLFVLVEESNDQRTCSYEMQVCIEFWIIQLRLFIIISFTVNISSINCQV